jgi:hypothetical protein
MRRFPAGSITIGLERRELDPDIVEQFYGNSPERDLVLSDRRLAELDDGGPSIHVFGTEDAREYLRFDCFRKEPHFHFILPDQPHQIITEIDETVQPLEWAMSALRTQLPGLLARSGGEHLSGGVDVAQLERALDAIAALEQTAP